jgi:anaerobic selenocysteine-containing dehydrogenase/Fe-S-cluster-containing dehydrogenase component
MPVEVSRRSFLKLAAASGAAAAIPGCKPAARHLIPYVIPDDDVIPGTPTFFASSCNECAAGCGVVARVREGRVIKLEGNPVDPISQGASCARGQAALQGLYNPDRLQRPHRRGGDGLINPITWDDAMGQLNKALREAVASPDQVAFIGPPMGPAHEWMVQQWMGALNSHLRVAYAPIDGAQERAALQFCFGKQFVPAYHIDRAEVLLSLRADFLETWGSPVELSRQYAVFHTPVNPGANAKFGLSYYVGPRMSMTAAKCDYFLPCHPAYEAALGLAILRVILDKGLAHPAPGLDMDALHKFVAPFDPAGVATKAGIKAETIEKMAQQFGQANGAVALAGSDDDAAHVAAWLLNAATGNVGKTVDLFEPETPAGAPAQDLEAAVKAMHDGNIKVAIITNTNPQFAASPEVHFGDALSKVPLVVWCGNVPDETAQFAHLLLPINHWVEDWGDTSARPGVYGLRQPTMTRVVYSKPLGDILIETARSAAPKSTALPFENTQDAVRAFWQQRFRNQVGAQGFEAFWDQALREGGHFTNVKPAQVKLQPAFSQGPVKLPEGLENAELMLSAFPHSYLYDGSGADKPWLQEIAEPVSQLVWDSWAEIHPDTAKRLKVNNNDLIQLASPLGMIEVPVHITKGVHPSAIAVPIGQGHTSYGRYARGRGANPWSVLPSGRMTTPIKFSRGDGQRELVSPAYTGEMFNRPIVETMTLAEFQRDEKPAPWEEPYPQPWELYHPVVYPVHEWGMTIDLNACTGCGACIAACYAENNIPFVGKEEVRRGHIKQWIRLERYFPETTDSPELLTMPMLCQQCSHAPCEPVCPVFAAVHDNEGLNLQVYNRCIGTRYCENNCPYKVRRFNWFKPAWPKPLELQLNPDVTVRGAGVMEKCTFCVQRIRFGEIQALTENRKVRDGEIVPACAEACPSRAITFGDMKDPESAMMKRRQEHEIRTYKALEPLNTLPAIAYLRQVYRPRGEV